MFSLFVIVTTLSVKLMPFNNHRNTMYCKQFIILFFISILSACSSINDIPVEGNQVNQDIETRNKQVAALNEWTITGKIAFINSQQRQSATLYWQKNETEKTESLNLSTLFGIKVLELEQRQDNFTLEVDGNVYDTQNLDALIYSLTGLNLPTRAMNHWLKGLAFLPTDKIVYHAKTQLPQSLTSRYNNKVWQVKYSNYYHIEQFQLAKQLTITQGDLRIKIVIHSWKT